MKSTVIRCDICKSELASKLDGISIATNVVNRCDLHLSLNASGKTDQHLCNTCIITIAKFAIEHGIINTLSDEEKEILPKSHKPDLKEVITENYSWAAWLSHLNNELLGMNIRVGIYDTEVKDEYFKGFSVKTVYERFVEKYKCDPIESEKKEVSPHEFLSHLTNKNTTFNQWCLALTGELEGYTIDKSLMRDHYNEGKSAKECHDKIIESEETPSKQHDPFNEWVNEVVKKLSKVGITKPTHIFLKNCYARGWNIDATVEGCRAIGEPDHAVIPCGSIGDEPTHIIAPITTSDRSRINTSWKVWYEEVRTLLLVVGITKLNKDSLVKCYQRNITVVNAVDLYREIKANTNENI